MFGPVREEGQPAAELRHDRRHRVVADDVPESGRATQELGETDACTVGHDDLGRVGVPDPDLLASARRHRLDLGREAVDVGDDDVREFGREREPQRPVAGLRHDQEPRFVGIVADHRREWRVGLAGERQWHEDQRARVDVGVPDGGDGLGNAGADGLRAGERRQRGHVRPRFAGRGHADTRFATTSSLIPAPASQGDGHALKPFATTSSLMPTPRVASGRRLAAGRRPRPGRRRVLACPRRVRARP